MIVGEPDYLGSTQLQIGFKLAERQPRLTPLWAKLLTGLKWFTKKDCTITKNIYHQYVPTTYYDLVNLNILCCDIISYVKK